MKFGRRAESPIDDQLAEADIQDRLALANTLRQRSMEGAQLDNVGGHLIGSPWARALSSVAQGAQGAGERKAAYGMAGDLATSKRERLAQALGGAGQEPTPEARLKRGMELMGNPDPQAQAVGRYMAESAQKEIEQAAERQQKQYGETNKDLRHMQDLYQRDQEMRYKAEHGQLPGMGTLYGGSEGYIGRKADGSWGYIEIDGRRAMPGAYDPQSKYNLAGAGAVGAAAGDQVAGGGAAIPPTPFTRGQSGSQNASPMPPQNASPMPPRLGYKAQQDAAKAGPITDAKKTAEEAAAARAALERAQIDLPSTLKQVNDLTRHPGLSGAVGLKGSAYMFGLREKPFPGTPEADFQTKFDSLMAKQFLVGYEVLKGGGAITEVEGAQAKAAMTALSQAQSEADFKNALIATADAIKRGVDKLKKVAGMTPSQAVPPQGGAPMAPPTGGAPRMRFDVNGNPVQ